MTNHTTSSLDLDDIETRANAATPGPWCTDSWEIYQGSEDDAPSVMQWIGETCRAEDSDGSRNDAAFIAAALDDYRLTTPADQQTPHGAAERAGEYLATSGWGLYVPRDTTTDQPLPRPRSRCPHCCVHHTITQAGRIRRHGPHGHPCPGSGTPAPA